MKAEDLWNHMSAIDDEMIEQSEQGIPKSAKNLWKRRLFRATAIAAAVLAVGAAALLVKSAIVRKRNEQTETGKNSTGTGEPGKKTVTPKSGKLSAAFALMKAVYPQMAKMPLQVDYMDKFGVVDTQAYYDAYNKWLKTTEVRESVSYDIQMQMTDGVSHFAQTSLAELLKGEDGENRACSPLNIYLALGMLAEVTDGTSREQILNLLGIRDIEMMRSVADAVWRLNYSDNGQVTSILASSLWLRDDEWMTYVPETVKRLAETYRASSFRGKMGSEGYDKAIQDWLNEQTGDLLEDAVNNVHFDPATALALATTVYYKAQWAKQFKGSATDKEVFHAKIGDKQCDFMHGSSVQEYYAGEQFVAMALDFEGVGAGDMIFFLPDEGVSVKDLLTDPQVFALFGSGEEKPQSKKMVVTYSIPKFDVASQMNFGQSLRNLGVTDVFESAKADFTPIISNSDNVCLSNAMHGARVTIDEEGVEAAAFTVLVALGTSILPEERVNFVLDRPFLFAIRTENKLPLFVGIVENP